MIGKKRFYVPTREACRDKASTDLCLWTSIMAGMISPGLYNVPGRSVMALLVSNISQSAVLIPRETDEPMVKPEAMLR